MNALAKHLRKERMLTQAYQAGIPMGVDFHELHSKHVDRLVDIATKHGYRKSFLANGSTARSLYEYLNRR